jgi:hypothetical protein
MTGDIIHGPDNYNYKVVPRIPGRAERMLAVSIRVASLEISKQFWVGAMGMTEFPVPTGLESPYPTSVLGFNEKDAFLQLIEVQDGQAVEHALSSGRIAFSCASADERHSRVSLKYNCDVVF